MSRIRIQNFLKDTLSQVACHKVTYDKNGHAKFSIVKKDEINPIYETELPKTCLVNELSDQYDVDNRHGREYVLKKTVWKFLAIIEFRTEIEKSNLEEALCRPLYLKVSEGGSKSYTIFLLNMNADHGTRGDKSKGTKIQIMFEVHVPRN